MVATICILCLHRPQTTWCAKRMSSPPPAFPGTRNTRISELVSGRIRTIATSREEVSYFARTQSRMRQEVHEGVGIAAGRRRFRRFCHRPQCANLDVDQGGDSAPFIDRRASLPNEAMRQQPCRNCATSPV
jgi:hypothetical protein